MSRTALAGPAQVGFQAQLWRAIAAYRFASLGYAAILLGLDRANYVRWGWAWVIFAWMVVWTVITTRAYARPAGRTTTLLGVDLVVTAAALLSTDLVQHGVATYHADMPVTATWVAGPVLAWAVAAGRRAGMAAAAALGICDLFVVHHTVGHLFEGSDLNGAVLLLLAGWVVGYVTRLAERAEHALQHATEIEAASRERDRIARDIHDSVLQVLALVQRRGAEAGGEAAEIGRLAGEQEAALRTLIASADGQAVSFGRLPSGEMDLAALLARENSATVSVIAPAEPVRLAGEAAEQAALAVRAALDNVRRHCAEATRAWVLIEDENSMVTVTIRDDGPGIPAGRLAGAAAEGRLGVSHAIRGRIRDLGGTVSIHSGPDAGTEVTLRIPRAAENAGRA
jgi:signal transduction histidine kinase